MQTLTLSELKAQNQAEEAQQNQNQADYEAANDIDDVNLDNEAPADIDQDDQLGDETPKQSQDEAWLGDGQEEGGGSAELKFTDKDIGAAKRKLQSKLQAERDEVQRLKEELERLKSTVTQPVVQNTTEQVPTLEQFEFDHAAHAQAMKAWVLNSVQEVSKAQQEQNQKLQEQKALEAKLNSHYERAAQLVQKHNIDPDLYRSAGLKLRQAVDEVFPGAGDAVTDKMLAVLGEGSEKLEYHLGRNSQKRDILKAKLLEDKSGLTATVYLGQVLAGINEPVRKKTQAPAPAARANGGDVSSNSDASSYLKKYNAEKDLQKRFDIRMQAKRAGIDVKNW